MKCQFMHKLLYISAFYIPFLIDHSEAQKNYSNNIYILLYNMVPYSLFSISQNIGIIIFL